MAKSRSIYICSACGAESPQWFGKCPSCGIYGTLEEQAIATNNPPGVINRGGWQSSSRPYGKSAGPAQPRISVRFSQISQEDQERFASGYGELDRVLGGGVVPGSLVLIGGDPGIGKSTLLLQVANQLALRLPRILYVSAEESGQQVKLRASRLGVAQAGETDQEEMEQPKPKKLSQASQPEDVAEESNLYVLPETDQIGRAHV